MPEQPAPAATADKAPEPQQQQAQAPAAAASPSHLSAAEEKQLGSLLQRRDQAAGAVEPARLKVEPPHAEFTFGGVTVASEYTSVPGSMAAAVTAAAAEAGVKITQET